MGADPGDQVVLARAFADGRVLVTMDTDFGTLVVAEFKPHAGIIRLVVDLPSKQIELCHYVLLNYAKELAGGALVTASIDRVRIRQAGTD
jgi:predicted nuclease of predicted toxin-antitoxin system